MGARAAFFDLDRTLIRRSSALALAGSFQERGLIGRKQLAKAAAWQVFFAARGAGAEVSAQATNGVVERIVVALGVRDERAEVVEVTSGLAAGDVLLLARAMKNVGPGARVELPAQQTAKPAAPAPAGSATR